MKKGRKSPAKKVRESNQMIARKLSGKPLLKSALKKPTKLKKSKVAPKKNSKVRLKKIARRSSQKLVEKSVENLIPRQKSSYLMPEVSEDLPFSYNHTKLVMLARDPMLVFLYWDFSEETWEWMQDLFRQDGNMTACLRIYNLDHKTQFDVQVSLEGKKWYLDLGCPDASFEAELGLLGSDGKFYVIARSNRVRTPRNGASKKIDPNWEGSFFDELYRMSGGPSGAHSSDTASLFKKPIAPSAPKS